MQRGTQNLRNELLMVSQRKRLRTTAVWFECDLKEGDK